MACVVVIWVNRPFAKLDGLYGFTKAAEIRAEAAPKEDIQVLVLSGFENIDEKSKARLAELKVRFVDAASDLASVRSKYAYAARGYLHKNPDLELMYLRTIVVEEHFGDQPVLIFDADLVWKVDPFELLSKWREGGSFVLTGCPCVMFAKDRSWFESYRDGMEKAALDRVSDRQGVRLLADGIRHDQDLIQHLLRKQLMPNDTANLFGHGFEEKYVMISNPLGFKADKTGPLRFERRNGREFINDREVPFWHMQTSFSRYLAIFLLVEMITGRTHFRIPFVKNRGEGQANRILDNELLSHLHFQLQRDRLTFSEPRLKNAKQITMRAHLYDQFFYHNLAERVFTPTVWWKDGVWAS